MFLGEHQHSLDAKGRVILPARFRDQLEGGAVMAKALDGCLAVYPVDEFERVAANLREARARGATERQAARTYFAGAVEITPDKQGRVAVPAHLRTFANLEREVIVAGNLDHIEIWNAEAFSRRDREGSASILDGEGIDDFGM
jgi:MraZ protein